MYTKWAGCDIDSILNVLGDKKTESNIAKVRKTLKEALVLQTKGTDTELLFPLVVKYIASNDMVSKKIAYNFISHHGHRKDLILLAINCLLKDCNDPSPMTRGLALRTLTDLPNQVDYSVPQVLKALDDSSAYVRRVAVMACAKVSRECPELVETHGFVDVLYDKIRDSDPIVVVNCLNGLDELLANEGGAVINKNIAYHLLNNIRLFSDWSLVSILKFLQRYTPESEDEIYAIMNLTDQNLSSNNATVVAATMEYFLFLVHDLPHLTPDIFERASAKLLHILSLGHPEINYALLCIFQGKLDDREYIKTLQEHYESFYCRQTDPLYIKAQKMEILPQLVNSDNLLKIVLELSFQSSQSDPPVAQLAIKAMGKIAIHFKDTIPVILQKFDAVLSKRNWRSTSEVLQVLQKLELSQCEEKASILDHVRHAVDLVEDTPGKCALFMLLGQHGKDIADAPYIMEKFIENADAQTEESLLCELMSGTVTLFKSRPAECQEMLGRLLDKCYEDRRVHVQDRAKFYYALLKAGIAVTEK